MEENKNQSLEAVAEETAAKAQTVADDEPLDKNVRLMSPTRMVMRRFSAPS